MAKVFLEYKDLKNICCSITDKIKREEEKPFTEIVAVTRGGLTAAHIFAKELNLDVGMFLPKPYQLALNNDITEDTRLLLVEDLVAQGRTYAEIKDFFRMFNESITNEMTAEGVEYEGVKHIIDWEFCPILIDDSYEPKDEFKYFGYTSKNWVVFPYEDSEKVVIGDRGLHRDGSDQYGK